MKHWESLIVEDEFYIPGRGTVLVVDLQESGVVDSDWVDELPLKHDDTVLHKNETWIVVGIEQKQSLVTRKINSRVGVLIKLLNKRS